MSKLGDQVVRRVARLPIGPAYRAIVNGMSNVLICLCLCMAISLIFPGLALPANEPTVHIKAGTLILIGVSSTSIVVAADSLAVHSITGQRSTRNKKIIPISNAVVCFMGGDSELRWIQNGKTLDEVDFVKIIEEWSKAHPNAQISDAYNSIDAQLLDAMKAVQHKHAFVADPIHSFSSFGCVGYEMGIPRLYESDYVAATTEDITRRVTGSDGGVPPGFFVALGITSVCDEITTTDATNHFSTFKSNAAIVRYRKAKSSHTGSALTESDLLTISRICLQATESSEGRAFDPYAKNVGPPNRYGVIDQRRGFEWVSAP
jgi:hypothetical protein